MPNTPAELMTAIQRICRKDPRYKPEAYLFVLAALHFTVSKMPQPRHDSEMTSGGASASRSHDSEMTSGAASSKLLSRDVPQRGASFSRSHVTGQELLEGIRLYGLDQFGPLARQVFERWGVLATEDFGRIVFILVDAKLLGKTEEDSIADFQQVYDFSTAFNPESLFKLPEEESSLPHQDNVI